MLFDIDLTLIRTDGAGRAAMTEAIRRLYGIDNPTDGIRFDGRTDHAIFLEAIDRHGLANGDGQEAYRRVTAEYVAMLPASLRARGGTVLPGVSVVLDALEAAGVAVGLATGNMRAGAQAKLSHFDLWHRFAGGGFGDATSNRGEVVSQAIVEVAGAVGIEPDPHDALVIGDTPLDVAAAHQAGARALAVATGSYDVAALRDNGAEYVVADLSDTPALREILLG